MSQRAAWQLERLGIVDVHDFVYGKSYWIGSGRPTVGTVDLAARVLAHVSTDVSTVAPGASVGEVRTILAADAHGIVLVVNDARVILGTVRVATLESADDGQPVDQVMRVGPTTVRPDELAAAVRERMAKRNVSALPVSRPTGELIGLLPA
jgi:CBS domain-containing protein